MCFSISLWFYTSYRFRHLEQSRIFYSAYVLYQDHLKSLKHSLDELSTIYFLNKKDTPLLYYNLLENSLNSVLIIEKFYTLYNHIFCQIPLYPPLKNSIVSSEFGIRKDPFAHSTAFHTGVDLVSYKGAPVYATADGTIKEMGYDNNYGKKIIIQHAYQFYTLYAHLSTYHKKIHTGDKIKQGDIIGYIGNTGRSQGEHLHYEIQLFEQYLDPRDFLN